MPSTMKSLSIEEELMGDVWEQAPPDEDAEMGFFEVSNPFPRYQRFGDFGSSEESVQGG